MPVRSIEPIRSQVEAGLSSIRGVTLFVGLGGRSHRRSVAGAGPRWAWDWRGRVPNPVPAQAPEQVRRSVVRRAIAVGARIVLPPAQAANTATGIRIAHRRGIMVAPYVLWVRNDFGYAVKLRRLPGSRESFHPPGSVTCVTLRVARSHPRGLSAATVGGSSTVFQQLRCKRTGEVVMRNYQRIMRGMLAAERYCSLVV